MDVNKKNQAVASAFTTNQYFDELYTMIVASLTSSLEASMQASIDHGSTHTVHFHNGMSYALRNIKAQMDDLKAKANGNSELDDIEEDEVKE